MATPREKSSAVYLVDLFLQSGMRRISTEEIDASDASEQVVSDPCIARGPDTVTGTESSPAVTVLTPATCSFSLSPTSATVGKAAGTGSITVTATAGCEWSAVSHNSWLRITSGASGIGNGTINYEYDEHSGPSPRIGHITLNEEVFTLTQSGTCVYTLSISSTEFDVIGGSGTIQIQTSETTCPWEATTDVTWLHFSGASSGTGNGFVYFKVDYNYGAARVGRIFIAGRIFVITQQGSLVIAAESGVIVGGLWTIYCTNLTNPYHVDLTGGMSSDYWLATTPNNNAPAPEPGYFPVDRDFYITGWSVFYPTREETSSSSYIQKQGVAHLRFLIDGEVHTDLQISFDWAEKGFTKRRTGRLRVPAGSLVEVEILYTDPGGSEFSPLPRPPSTTDVTYLQQAFNWTIGWQVG